MDGLFFLLAIIVLARSPIGRALADRLSGRSPQLSDPGGADIEALEARLDERFLELEDRLDFTERMLHQRRNSRDLPPID